MSFADNLDDRIRDRLKRDFKFRKEARGWLREGQCPECNRWEFFVRAEKPRVVRCGRLNSCGHEVHVRDLFPDLFEAWSDRVPATPEDPNAAADAYLLHDRGFDLQFLRGHYSQETYQDRRRGLTSATVRFPLQTQPGAWWERLIDRPDRFDRKANFSPVKDSQGNDIGPSYAGHAWLTPGHAIEDYATAYEIWFTEGVFNTIALEQGDFRATRDPDHPIHKPQPPADQEAFDFATAMMSQPSISSNPPVGASAVGSAASAAPSRLPENSSRPRASIINPTTRKRVTACGASSSSARPCPNPNSAASPTRCASSPCNPWLA